MKRSSCRQPSHHEPNHGDVDQRFRCFRQALIVSLETTMAPAKRTCAPRSSAMELLQSRVVLLACVRFLAGPCPNCVIHAPMLGDPRHTHHRPRSHATAGIASALARSYPPLLSKTDPSGPAAQPRSVPDGWQLSDGGLAAPATGTSAPQCVVRALSFSSWQDRSDHPGSANSTRHPDGAGCRR